MILPQQPAWVVQLIEIERVHVIALILNNLYHLQVEFPDDESLDEAIEYAEGLISGR